MGWAFELALGNGMGIGEIFLDVGRWDEETSIGPTLVRIETPNFFKEKKDFSLKIVFLACILYAGGLLFRVSMLVSVLRIYDIYLFFSVKFFISLCSVL